MEVRENLIKLCEKINDGHYKITPDCAEYKMFEQWITDEQITVMMALTSMKPSFVPIIARKAGMSIKRTREVLHEITDIGLSVLSSRSSCRRWGWRSICCRPTRPAFSSSC